MNRTTSILPGAAPVVDVKAKVSPAGFGAAVGERRLVEDSSSSLEAADPASSGNETMSIHAADARVFEAVGLIEPNMAISPSTLTDGTHAVAYTPVALSTVGGISPYTYAVATGSSLPAGMTLSSGGSLAGTPTTADDYEFSVTVTDANGRKTTQAFALTVA